ncbi:LPS export ABC transporter periplasmic protein LptC [Rhodobacteraceae bacterium NNCM2]|nr:LPS export ABC transporter periplasmic protein LptC [Coraliihabitans acroporae]
MKRKRRTSQSAVIGYSRRIKWMKVVLPLAAAMLIAAIFLIGRWDDESLFSNDELAALGAGMQLENPRFSGRTENGDPFIVRARRATPDGPSPELINLDAPVGEMAADDGRQIAGRSDSGVMRRSEDELTLTGNVVITTSDGYRADTEELKIDLKNKTAVAPGHMKAVGPSGSIVAGKFRVERPENDDGSQGSDMVLWFENDVRVIFIPKEAR